MQRSRRPDADVFLQQLQIGRVPHLHPGRTPHRSRRPPLQRHLQATKGTCFFLFITSFLHPILLISAVFFYYLLLLLLIIND